jgi:P-aminobenzoate N-oxygenase AurF
MAITAPEKRVARLSHVSAKRHIEPDEDVVGDFGPGQILPDELLLTAGLDLELTPEQKVTLAREQTAAMLDGGIRLEAVLLGGFGLMLANWRDLTDPRLVYLLHEVGEETRHSRLFVRMLTQLQPTTTNPFHDAIGRAVANRIYRLTATNKLLLCTMVLAGEEIPDLIQRRAIEHPDTDDYVRRANIYHREEEARHIAFAGILLPELWQQASRREKWLVRRVAPLLVRLMVNTQLTHPQIYAAAGLPPLRTHRAVLRSSNHRDVIAEAMRAVLKTVLASAPELQGRVPRGWRRICQVDRNGRLAPTPSAVASR